MDNQLRTVGVPLTAIVLAGGKSSRMGQDKALIPIQGVACLQLVCGVASALCNPVYVVTPWPERYQNLRLDKCQFIREAMSLPHGPLVGFAQGLAQVQTDWVLLLACDLPKLRVEVLQDWAARLNIIGDEQSDEDGSNPIALLTHHAKGWDPLCGFYHRRCLTGLIDYINQGGRSFQHWLAQHPVQLLPLPDAQMLFNCNTPADLADLEKYKLP